jgi:class 3 adenylate cyclase/tetratricopeptide (TPR) repeat protein
MRGERRTVTMLFADIKGSTAAAEQLDPEDWTEIINGAFEHLIAPVYRYEGTLARLLGDAILAFFGAPIAHEDDPVRAVRAGLEITEAMKSYKAEILERWMIMIDVRVGINTGLVVVGEVGSDLRVDYTALGDAVNVAARMEQTAEPGTVRVTADTWSLVAEHFDGEEIGPVEVKGKSEPVTAVRVVDKRAVAVEGAGGHQLFGRSEETAFLEALRERLLGGSGWIASVIGEAGVGKSGLLRAFRGKTAQALPTAFASGQSGHLGWMGAFTKSYDASIPYATISDLLRRWWELDQAIDPYGSVRGAVTQVAPGVEPVYLGYVVGVQLPESEAEFLGRLEPPVIKARTREAVASYLEAEAGRRPLIVVLEDLHWADPMSLTLIEGMLDLAERTGIGMLLSMRPYRDEPTWHIHEVGQRDHAHRYRTIELGPLSDDVAMNLLNALLSPAEVSDATRVRILKRSDGNPLFIEQMAGAIRDVGGGLEEGLVPSGLSAVLTSRLDRLDTGSKLVAQVASVIGSEFDRRTLASLTEDKELDRRVTDLLRREILVERPGGMLNFHHALMREAAYATMLIRTRRELHRRLAEHLVADDPHAVQEIALHYVEAGNLAAAFPHLVVAGESSARSMALSDAIRQFSTALENIPATADPELVVRAHDGLGLAYSLVPDLTRTDATYQRLADYADAAGRPSAKVTALNRLAMTTAMMAGDLDLARRYLDEAMVLARESGDERGLAEYHMNACTIAGLSGDLDAAIGHDEQTIQRGGDLGAGEIRAEGMARLATNAVWFMDFDRADSAVRDALEAARDLDDELGVAIVKVMGLSRLRLREGDFRGALEVIRAYEQTLVRYASFYAPLAGIFVASLQFDLGDVEGAVVRLAEISEWGMPLYVATSSATLARMYASLGITGPLKELVNSAIEAVEAPLGNFLASSVWADLGFSAFMTGDFKTAAERFERGLATSSSSSYWEKPRLLIGQARVHTAQREYEEAHRALDEAQTFLLEKELRTFDHLLGHGRGEVLLAEERATEASRLLTEVLVIADERGLRVPFVEAAATASRAASARGDSELAGRHLAAARAKVTEMTSTVVDPVLKAAMESSWMTRLDEPVVS